MEDDQITDYIDDHTPELLQQFIEDEDMFKLFEEWLWAKEQKTITEDLLNKFADSKEGRAFYEWATELLSNQTAEYEANYF